MKKYTATYMKFFGYGIEDFIPCEITGNRCSEIHHIKSRSKRMDLVDDISNLMALTREMHEKYGDKKQYYKYLQDIHNRFMENNKK